MILDSLHWQLSILTKATQYKNLTSASNNVGLSQPQLSRIIQQLESELNMVLLDRTAKRKSGWTQAAFNLSDVYAQHSRRLSASIHSVVETQVPNHITIATLEGLADNAMTIAHKLLKHPRIQTVELDMYDLSELEKRFLIGDVDIAITSKIPTKQKLKNVIEIGFQTFETIQKNGPYTVLSAYEFGRMKKRAGKDFIVSNSLEVRKKWVQRFGGTATVPSQVTNSKTKDSVPALVIAADTFSAEVWKLLL
jgi:hypothetical protein